MDRLIYYSGRRDDTLPELGSILNQLGLAEYTEKFQDEGYDYKTLLEIRDDDLEVIIPKRGLRQKLRSCIQALKNKELHVQTDISNENNTYASKPQSDCSRQGSSSTTYDCGMEVLDISQNYRIGDLIFSDDAIENVEFMQSCVDTSCTSQVSTNKSSSAVADVTHNSLPDKSTSETVYQFDNLTQLLNDVKNPNQVSTNKSSSSSAVTQDSLPDKSTSEKVYQFDIRTELLNDARTSNIIDNKVPNGHFILREDRQKIAAVLVDKLFGKLGFYPSKKAVECIAKDLVKEFPLFGDCTEKDNGYEMWYYYTPCMHHPVGFLQERLQSQRRKIKLAKPEPQSQSEIDDGWQSENADENPQEDDDVVLYMQTNIGESITGMLKDTVFQRRTTIRKNLPVQEIISKYPRLFDMEGMICQDFNVRHPQLSMNVYKHWPQASQTLIRYGEASQFLFKKELGIELSLANLNSEQSSLLGFLLLPYLLPLCGQTEVEGHLSEDAEDEGPVRKSKRKQQPTEKGAAYAAKNVKRRKASTADTARSMIVIKPEMTSVADVLHEKTGRKPFILALGNKVNLTISQYFVVVETVGIPCGKSFYVALDTCFKIYHVLKLDYPSPCKPAWLFMEHGIFRRGYGKQSIPSQVKALIGQIIPKVMPN